MKIVLTLVLALPFAWTMKAAEIQRKPNVVFLLADDLGWSDVSVHSGGTISTPQIDRLFHQGIELRNYMGWCVCSPTRAMLLTGRHPFRVGTGPEVGGELPKEETTIAEGFKANGYATGVFGKWHNGGVPDTPEWSKACEDAGVKVTGHNGTGLGVNAHGFDEAWVYYGGGPDYYTRREGKGPACWWHNMEYRGQDAGYTDDLVTQHAVEFIRDNKDRPFFCYVPFHIVHGPLQAKDSDLEGVDASVTDKTKRVYAAMVQAMDKNVATILAELDKLGLRENTIVVFSSDNGATPDGSNLPLRGGKHTIYEGGVRLPTVISWPKGGLVGNKWDGLCGALDMFPTLIAMTGGKMPATRPLDGKNIWPALRQNGASPVESYYWAFENSDAIRTADWKLMRYFNHNELFDIRKDEAEANDVASAHADVVKALTTKMDVWVDSMGASLSHRKAPAKLDAKPAPEGEVLEVSVTVSDKAKPNDRMAIPFADSAGRVVATDYLEYDVAVAPDSLHDGFYYSPCKIKDQNTLPVFKRGLGIDQFGREQATGPEPRGGPGVWEHRIIGICAAAPGELSRQAIVFSGQKAGTFKIYLDNLRIRHADGSTSPIWTNSQNTHAKKIEDTASFTNVRLRAVALTDVFSSGK